MKEDSRRGEKREVDLKVEGWRRGREKGEVKKKRIEKWKVRRKG